MWIVLTISSNENEFLHNLLHDIFLVTNIGTWLSHGFAKFN